MFLASNKTKDDTKPLLFGLLKACAPWLNQSANQIGTCDSQKRSFLWTVSGILLLLSTKQFATIRRPEVIHFFLWNFLSNCQRQALCYTSDRQSDAPIINVDVNDGCFCELNTKEQFWMTMLLLDIYNNVLIMYELFFYVQQLDFGTYLGIYRHKLQK